MNPIPVVTSISAVEGDSLAVTINGSGFVATSFAEVNGRPVLTRLLSGTRLQAMVDLGGARVFEGTVSVTNPAPGGGTSQTVPFSWSATASPAPTVTAIAPAFAEVGADSVVVRLTGSGFVRQTFVTVAVPFAASGSYRVRYTSPTSVSVTLPAAELRAARTLPLIVYSPPPGGGQATTSFEVRAPVPVLTALATASAPVGLASFALVVNGTGFTDSSKVQVNGAARPTTRTATGTLTATLTDADLSETGTTSITVVNAGPGGGTSNVLPLTVTGVVPTIALLPSTGGHVGSGFTLAVHGSGFARNSVVRWNGTDLATNYRSGRRLTATVPDGLMASTGTASITVFTPGTGGGSSSPVAFVVRTLPSASGSSQVVAVRGGDVAYSEVTGTLFTSAKSADSVYANRLVEINPATGAVLRSVAIGSDPNLMAMADDGRQLYVGIDGQNSVRRIDVTTFVPGLELPLAGDSFLGATYAGDIAVLPNRPRSVAVTRYFRGISPPLAGTTIFDDATPRSMTGPGHTGGSRIEFAGTDSLLFGYNNLSTGFDLFTFSVTGSGLTTLRSTGALISGFATEIYGASGRIYATNGVVVDAELQSRVGTISAGATAMFIDPALGRAFAMFGGRIDVIDLNTFLTVGNVAIPEATGSGNPFFTGSFVPRLMRCGQQCLAWATGTRVVLARSPMFGP